jgi:hypothetical protein
VDPVGFDALDQSFIVIELGCGDRAVNVLAEERER